MSFRVTTSSSMELDYGLRSTFFGELDVEQKLRIFDLTTRASRELHRWAARYPLIRRMRVWPLSLSVAAAAPFASVAALVTMARMNLWVFTIDDLFDEEIVPYPTLQRRVATYKAVINGERIEHGGERDSLVLALQDICNDLQGYSLWPRLRQEWAGALVGTLDAMAREQQWRTWYREGYNDVRLPSYATYLKHSLYSVGGPPHIWTTLIAIDDASLLDHLERLKQMEQIASLCIRLANDLKSYAKEITEGKINSIVIRQREAISRGATPEEGLELACQTTRQDIQHGLARCVALQHQAQTATGYPERAIADIARFVCDFYVHHDYHTFTTSSGRMA